MDAATWEQIDRIRAWLDEAATAEEVGEENLRMRRVLKIGEEVGEVSEALLGVYAANPRKGASHTWEDVHKELVDVAVTTFVALATLSDEPGKVFEERLVQLVGRIPRQTGSAA
jgi:NTP pyrophosphatase (non-canonical NTP hydrolase)